MADVLTKHLGVAQPELVPILWRPSGIAPFGLSRRELRGSRRERREDAFVRGVLRSWSFASGLARAFRTAGIGAGLGFVVALGDCAIRRFTLRRRGGFFRFRLRRKCGKLMLWRLVTANRQPPSVQTSESKIDLDAEPSHPKQQDNDQQQKEHRRSSFPLQENCKTPPLTAGFLHLESGCSAKLSLSQDRSRTISIALSTVAAQLPHRRFWGYYPHFTRDMGAID